MNSRRTAAISMSIATLIGGVIAGTATAIVWVTNTISTAIAPVEAQTQANTTDIAVIKSQLHDISITNQWIQAALEANGIKPAQTFISQPK